MRRLAEFILVLACYVVVNGINEAVLTPRDVAHPEDILKRVSPVSKKDQLKIPRSITHGEGAGRKCEHEDDLKKWLPDLESPKPPEGGHYHLLLAVSDDQLAFLINWLAVAYEFGYLPTPRILVHYVCEGEATRNFVEHHLLAKCIHPPERNMEGVNGNETIWRQIIKDRLGTFLHMVSELKTEENDLGAITFDVDAVWIRNMIDVFDHFAIEQSFDLIAQGVMMDRKSQSYMDGKVITNFGGVFVKNSEAGKALAARAMVLLNDPKLDFDWPDQDYISHVLFNSDEGKGTQRPIEVLEHLSKDSSYHTEHCEEHHDTCTWLASGVYGSYDAVKGGSVQGKYMFFPEIVAPLNCDVLCSGGTVLFQHCGLANCAMEQAKEQAKGMQYVENHQCHEIPEFVLSTHKVATVLKEKAGAAGADFKPAEHGTFDSRHEMHQVEVVQGFVNRKRLHDLCEAYSAICKVDSNGKLVMVAQT